jgi:hypothetical protein
MKQILTQYLDVARWLHSSVDKRLKMSAVDTIKKRRKREWESWEAWRHRRWGRQAEKVTLSEDLT